MSRLAILDSPPHPTSEAESSTRLIDSFGRRLTYLRVSVTDRCNFRCTYCLPEDADFPFGDKAFLSADEIETIVGALVRLGIRRVRLTIICFACIRRARRIISTSICRSSTAESIY